jgi:hypothetical protein
MGLGGTGAGFEALGMRKIPLPLREPKTDSSVVRPAAYSVYQHSPLTARVIFLIYAIAQWQVKWDGGDAIRTKWQTSRSRRRIASPLTPLLYMQIKNDVEATRTETSAVFVVVSAKERYPTASTCSIILQKRELRCVLTLHEAQSFLGNQHSAGQNFATFCGTRRLQHLQDPATAPYPGPCGKKVTRQNVITTKMHRSICLLIMTLKTSPREAKLHWIQRHITSGNTWKNRLQW